MSLILLNILLFAYEQQYLISLQTGRKCLQRPKTASLTDIKNKIHEIFIDQFSSNNQELISNRIRVKEYIHICVVIERSRN